MPYRGRHAPVERDAVCAFGWCSMADATARISELEKRLPLFPLQLHRSSCSLTNKSEVDPLWTPALLPLLRQDEVTLEVG